MHPSTSTMHEALDAFIQSLCCQTLMTRHSAAQLTLCTSIPRGSTLWRREVFFETNGVPRVVEVVEAKAMEAKASREKGDPNQPGSVSAPMSGEVIKINTQAGKLQSFNIIDALPLGPMSLFLLWHAVQPTGRRNKGQEEGVQIFFFILMACLLVTSCSNKLSLLCNPGILPLFHHGPHNLSPVLIT